MKRYSLFIFLVLSIFLSGIGIAQSKVATSAASFLGMSVGARAMSMGGAFVAISNDAMSTYYNPGAIAAPGISQVIVSHTGWLVGTNFDWAGLVLNLDGTNAIGVSVTQLNYGEGDVTTDLQQTGTGEKWTASDMAIGISYSRNLTDRFSLGGTAKFIQLKIWNSSANSFALDVGLLYNVGESGLKIGMSIANFGSDMKLDGKDLYRQIDLDVGNSGSNKTIVSQLRTDEYPLPLLFRAGVSMDAMRSDDLRLTVAADALRPSDNNESVNVGAEFGFKEMLFVRAGKRQLFLSESMEEYSFGGGLRYELSGVTALSVDFSYLQFKVFGGIQTIDVGLTF